MLYYFFSEKVQSTFMLSKFSIKYCQNLKLLVSQGWQRLQWQMALKSKMILIFIYLHARFDLFFLFCLILNN